MYVDGKEVISSTSGKQTLVDYYDNLDEVLVQENVIESMEKRIQYLGGETNRLSNFSKKKFSLLKKLGLVLLENLIIGCTLFLNYATLVSSNCVLKFVLAFTCCFPYLLINFGICVCFDYTSEKKDLKSFIKELDYLNKQIVMEEVKLVNLKKDMKKSKEDKEISITKVNDVERLKELKSYLKIASNEEKYYKYYQKGKLEEKLAKDENCTDFDIEIAKNYFEKKGPCLVKKK